MSFTLLVPQALWKMYAEPANIIDNKINKITPRVFLQLVKTLGIGPLQINMADQVKSSKKW